MSKVFVCLFVFASLALNVGAQYEYFSMPMQWSPALCRPKNTKCVKNPVNQFTIHGMWAANKTINQQPRQCSNNLKVTAFNTGMISKTTETELHTSWPNFKGDDSYFWRRQWYDHGTCSYSTFNQTQFFVAANDIWRGMQLFQILQAHGIDPSMNTFQRREDFVRAISNHIGVPREFEFSCPSNELLEIRLCRNHAGTEYINCTFYGSCGSTFKWKP